MSNSDRVSNDWNYPCLAEGCDYSSMDAAAVLIHIQEEHEVEP